MLVLRKLSNHGHSVPVKRRIEDGLERTIPEHARQQTRRPYPHWQRRHEAVLQWLLSHHTGKLYECARDTGYSPWHLSRIINSQHFQAVYRGEIEKQRRAHNEAYCQTMMGTSSK